MGITKTTRQKALNSRPVEIAVPPPFDQGKPHFNGASIFGATPNRQFMYAFPVRGERPLRFRAETPLPKGVTLSPQGILYGCAAEGEYKLAITARNSLGTASLDFTLKVGEMMLGRTPQLAWTSWNALVNTINQQKILAQAHALVSTGLSARGYYSVNIDSCWQGRRDKKTLALLANRRFPNMKRLVEAIHGLGLKAGIYSTPMVIAFGSNEFEIFRGGSGYPLDPDYYTKPFGGCGVVHFETQDAAQWAHWGFDYLKYDWAKCDVEHARLMREALDKTGKDFLMSLTVKCSLDYIEEYPKYAQLYRSNGDTADRWETIVANILSADKWLPHTGPGKWYDLDMLALGKMSLERTNKRYEFYTPIQENRLTRDEQITHFAVWCFMPSPVQLSCDLTVIDEFTLNLVSNEELLALNQDSLGAMAVLESDTNGLRVYRRKLSGNRTAFAFVNLAEEPRQLHYKFGREIKLRDPLAMRSLPKTDTLDLLLPTHGTRVFVERLS